MSSKEKNMPHEQAPDEMEKTLNQVEVEEQQTQAAVENDSHNEKIAELEEQLKQAVQRERDASLRTRAEVENIRRRTEQDVEKAHKFALEKFSGGLLPVIDNLERALEVADKENPGLTSMIEGVELTLKSLLDVVSKFGVESINEIGIPFNPELHQAMTMLESTEHEPNYVMMVMQKGYTLNGRLLRPAMVAVSKAKS